MIAQVLTAQDTDNRGSGRFDELSDRDFWSHLGWEVEAFPERYPDLIEQHRAAGLDPRDERYLDTPQCYPQPTRFTSPSGFTVCID